MPIVLHTAVLHLGTTILSVRPPSLDFVAQPALPTGQALCLPTEPELWLLQSVSTLHDDQLFLTDIQAFDPIATQLTIRQLAEN
jgi:hypothetical protein